MSEFKIVKVGASTAPVPKPTEGATRKRPDPGHRHKQPKHGVLKGGKTARTKITAVRDPAKSPPTRKATLKILTEKGAEKRRKQIRKTVRAMPDSKVRTILKASGLPVSEKTPPHIAKEILEGGMEAGMIVSTKTMTSIWGPLGWMTLHSVSTSYPENPTQSERQLLSSWLDLFRDTITCPHCKEHFGTMLQNYRNRFQNFLNSRQEFAMFVFRAHNTVNARLHKPVYQTLAECMDILRNNVKTRSAANYRISYLNHIHRYWRTIQDVSGIIALKKVMEMRKIEAEYFSTHDTQFNIELKDDVVVIPRNWVEKETEINSAVPVLRAPPLNATVRGGGIRVVGGRIRLR